MSENIIGFVDNVFYGTREEHFHQTNTQISNGFELLAKEISLL